MGPLIVAAPLITSSIAIGTKIGETIAEELRDKSLILKNKHRHRIYAVLKYKHNEYHNEWMVKGWFEIIPCDSISYSFPGIKNRIVYYYAFCDECGKEWGNGDTSGYVPTTDDAFTHFDSSRIGKIKNFSMANIIEDDIERELRGY